MRLVIADCSVDYAGRLTAHLPKARRLLMLKGDGSILIHSETGSYKPLNWMNPPCNYSVHEPDEEQLGNGIKEIWRVSQAKTADILWIQIFEIHNDINHELGKDPGLIKDGVEAHLQELMAAQIEIIGEGAKLVRREYMTPIGPVDILAKDKNGQSVAIEIKRRGEIDGVEQLSRYLELMNRDAALAPVRGIFAAQEIKPQARTLAEDRGIECLILDYEQLREASIDPDSLFW
jgi:RecB family endonuclease NucS